MKTHTSTLFLLKVLRGQTDEVKTSDLCVFTSLSACLSDNKEMIKLDDSSFIA